MKSKTFLLILAYCLVFMACGTSNHDSDMNPTMNPMNSASSSGLVASAPADSFTVNVQTPIDVLTNNPCAGEDINFVGTEHMVLHVTINGNSANIHQKINDQSVSGIGTITGTKYNRTGQTKDGFTVHVGEQETFVNSFKIIGPGPDNNLLVQEVFHITVNANGVVTVGFDKFFAVCS